MLIWPKYEIDKKIIFKNDKKKKKKEKKQKRQNTINYYCNP